MTATKTNPNADSDKVYEVLDKQTKQTKLVRARGLQTAKDHVAAAIIDDRFEARLLKSGELLDKVTAGATVETAGEQAQNAAEPEGDDKPSDPAPTTSKPEETADG